MQENQLSQFRPNESQRSRNVPDVLFVDEDGNPIEAGEENLIFVDEAGIEMTEEKAIRLIESGKFIDSRVLYDDELGLVNRSSSTNYGSVNSYSSNILNTIGLSQAQKSNSLTHAQMQAAQALQISQTQAKLNSVPTPTIDGSSSKLSTHAKMFADAHIKAREQAEELEQIEADAYSNYSPSHKSVNVQKIKSDRNKEDSKLKTESYSEEIYELDRIISEQENKMKKSDSYVKPAKKYQYLTESYQLKQMQQEEEQEREFLKNQLLRKQEELLKQHLLEKQQHDLEIHQVKLEKEERRRIKREKKELKEKERHRKELEKEQEEINLAREQELQIHKEINRLKEQEKLEIELNKRHDIIESDRKKSLDSKKSKEKKTYVRKSTDNAGFIKIDSNYEKSYSQKKLSNTGSLSKISRNSSKSSILEDKRSSQTNQHHINPKSSSKLIHKEKFITPQNRKQINQYSRDYDIMNLTQVGYLSGNNLIKNSEDIDMNMFENYYDQNSDLEFKSHNLDHYSTQFIDPFSTDLFKDEMVDIDFGAIDAFTEALNAQIIAEKNGNKLPQNLQFPSHVIASNHASFLDNQIFLGDCSKNVSEPSGVNVQFLPNKLKREEKNISNKEEDKTSMLERAAKAEYFKNQSFGSMIDVQHMKDRYENNSNIGINKSNSNLLYSLDSFIQNKASTNKKKTLS